MTYATTSYVRDTFGGLYTSRIHALGSSITQERGAITLRVMAKKRAAAARDWVFTRNNPSLKTFKRFKSFDCKYIVFQLEVGEQGTPHLQGFVQFTDKQRLSALKKLDKKAHWAKRKGTPYEAAHYCKKPEPECKCHHCVDTPRVYPQLIFEQGCISSEAQYKAHEIARSIKVNGLNKTIHRYPEAYLTMKHGMEGLATFYSPVREWQTVVTVVWGEAGLGKTRYGMMGPSPYKLAAFGGKDQTDFFGDYRPDVHETLVVDDFYGNWKYTTWLQVCDRYPTEVHTKGGFRQLLVRHIVFTSNSPPDEWYPNVLANADRRESFYRRINNVVHMTAGGYTVTKVKFRLKVRGDYHGQLLTG